jgi:hypothetical protein
MLGVASELAWFFSCCRREAFGFFTYATNGASKPGHTFHDSLLERTAPALFVDRMNAQSGHPKTLRRG